MEKTDLDQAIETYEKILSEKKPTLPATKEEKKDENVIVFDETPDEYEPNEQEIREYAEYLGMDVKEDQQYFYIAREGLIAPVPKPWKACQSKEGEIYYYNFETQESSWDHPSDDEFRKKYQRAKKGITTSPLAEIKEEPGESGLESQVVELEISDDQNDDLISRTKIPKVIQEEDIFKKEETSLKKSVGSNKKEEINFEEIINSVEKDEFKISDLLED